MDSGTLCVCVCVCVRVYHISDLLLLFFLIFRYELIKLGFCLSSGFNPSCLSLVFPLNGVLVLCIVCMHCVCACTSTM